MSTSAKTVFVPSSENLQFANTIVQSLDGLSVRRQQWEATDYKKANEGLYALLADCLAVYQSKFLKGADADRKALRKELVSRLQAAKIKVQKNSTTLIMLTRYVFGSDRKRAHGYAYVLAAAISRDVAASNLPAYITEQGGIEEIKRKMVISEKAQANRNAVNAAKAEVTADIEQARITPLTTLQISGVTGNYAVLLCKPTGDGSVSVVGTLSEADVTLVKAVVQRIAKARLKDKALSAEIKKETTDLIAQSIAANDAGYKKAA